MIKVNKVDEHLLNLQCPPEPPEPATTPSGKNPICARKLHKADREKLRRNKLNEQFSDLAALLDPERPKHDKATILGDSVLTLAELREVVGRLRSENAALEEEQKELTNEKMELRQEKSTLKQETEHLQTILHERMRNSMAPWLTSVDQNPSAVHLPPPFPLPVWPSQRGPEPHINPAPASSPSQSSNGGQGQAEPSPPCSKRSRRSPPVKESQQPRTSPEASRPPEMPSQLFPSYSGLPQYSGHFPPQVPQGGYMSLNPSGFSQFHPSQGFMTAMPPGATPFNHSGVNVPPAPFWPPGGLPEPWMNPTSSASVPYFGPPHFAYGPQPPAQPSQVPSQQSQQLETRTFPGMTSSQFPAFSAYQGAPAGVRPRGGVVAMAQGQMEERVEEASQANVATQRAPAGPQHPSQKSPRRSVVIPHWLSLATGGSVGDVTAQRLKERGAPSQSAPVDQPEASVQDQNSGYVAGDSSHGLVHGAGNQKCSCCRCDSTQTALTLGPSRGTQCCCGDPEKLREFTKLQELSPKSE